MSKIYLASSWRNQYYETTLNALRAAGFSVHDFRDPAGHFQWSWIDDNWQNWTIAEYKQALKNPLALIGYERDKGGIEESDVCVLLLPCNRSAHTEAGYMKGQGKKVFALIPEQQEPELMYNIFDGICETIHELIYLLNLTRNEEK